MIQAANSLKDAIKPDVMPFVKISEATFEEKKVVKIEVAPGTNKPYYLSDKGLKPSGVYVRKGSSLYESESFLCFFHEKNERKEFRCWGFSV